MGGQAPPTVETTADSVTGGPNDLACSRCGQMAWPLQDGQCQVCVRLDLALPLLGRQHAGSRVTTDRRSFLGALAALVVSGRWLRPCCVPLPVVYGGPGVALPPVHPNCRCDVIADVEHMIRTIKLSTWRPPDPVLVPGDVIRLTPPGEREALFTLIGIRDDRHLTLREL